MILRILAVASLALAVTAAPMYAAKPGKERKGDKPGRVLSRFDRDRNGVIDGTEIASVQAAYKQLRATDNNGELSEAEIAAAEVPIRKRGKAANKAAE